MIVGEQLTGGHARALLALPTQKDQLELARRIVKKNLSVRQAEMETGLVSKKKRNADVKSEDKPPHIKYLENAISNHLGTRVLIDEKRGGKGKISIEFYNHEDFERLATLLNLPLPR